MNFSRTLRYGMLTLGCIVAPALAPFSLAAEPDAAKAADPAPAGGRPTSRPGMRDPSEILDRTKAALAELKLSDEQKTKVQGFFESAKKDLDAAKELQGRDRFQAVLKALNDARENVAGVLTPEQKTQFREKLASLRGAGGNSGGPLAGLRESLEKLSLSDEQKQKVKDLLADTQKQALSLRDDAGGDVQAIREKFAALMQDTQSKLQDVLTPEQKEKLQKLMDEQRAPRGGQPGADSEK